MNKDRYIHTLGHRDLTLNAIFSKVRLLGKLATKPVSTFFKLLYQDQLKSSYSKNYKKPR